MLVSIITCYSNNIWNDMGKHKCMVNYAIDFNKIMYTLAV